MNPGARAPIAALGLAATLAMTALKAFIAIREATGGTRGLKVFDPNGAVALFVVRLAACVAETAALWLVVTFVATLAARPARWPAVGTSAALAGFSSLLGAVNVQVYHVFHRFVDSGMLDVARGGGHGYIEMHAPLWLRGAIVLVPLGTLAAGFCTARVFREDLEGLARRVLHPAVLLPLVLALIWASSEAQVRWCAQGRGDFAHDPVLVLVRSFLLPPAAPTDSRLTDAEVAELAPSPAAPSGSSPIANVVLVVWDGVPAAALSCYGAAHRTTPELSLRKDTLVFDRFYANATQSAPSALAIFGAVFNDPTVYVTRSAYPRFPVPHVAPWMEAHGRRTAFVGDDGWTALGPEYLKPHFQVALDAFEDWSRQPTGLARPEFQVASTSYGLARRFIREAGTAPFFITVWSSEAHPPFRAAEGPGRFDDSAFPELTADRVDDYRRFLACIWREDRELAGLMSELESRGLSGSTLVVLTADHGCAWGEHGYLGYGAGLYEEVVHVPLVLISPALPRTGRSAAVGTHVDLWPTVARLAGLAPHPDWQGRDLLDAAAATRTAYFSCLGQMGLRHDRFKYIWDHAAGKDELYDLVADPKELANVAIARPDLARRYRRKLEALATYQSQRVRQRAATAR